MVTTMPDPGAVSSRRRIVVLAVALSVLAAAVYCSGLNVSPIYFTKDEASYGIQSHSIAKTGRDINGRRFPLFFQESGFGIGRDPIYIYSSALVLKFLPMSEGALRIPTAVAGAISVGLVVVVAYEIYGSAALAAVCGVLLLVTPVFFIRSRAALSVILPVPFQLFWLWCLLRYSRDGRLRQLVGSTAALGVGMYSYLSMLFFAPFHLLFSLAEAARQRQWRHAVIAVGVLALLLLPLVWWQMTHPGHIGDIASSYRVYPAGLTPLQGLKDILSWSSLTNRSDIYWSAFNPSRLFFSGESGLVDSTRQGGLLPLAYMLLLPIGLYDFFSRPMTVPRLSILCVFVIGPIPGALVGEETIGRYLGIGPLAALLAVGAIDRLWQSGRVVLKVVAVGSVVLSLYLFAGFYRHYMNEWRIDSSMYFGGNLRGAMERVLAAPPSETPDLVFLSEKIPYVNTYWEFYRRKHDRDDLIGHDRGLRLTDNDWREAAGRVVAIVPGRDDPSASVLKAAGWTVQSEIYEFYGGPPSFIVLSHH